MSSIRSIGTVKAVTDPTVRDNSLVKRSCDGTGLNPELARARPPRLRPIQSGRRPTSPPSPSGIRAAASCLSHVSVALHARASDSLYSVVALVDAHVPLNCSGLTSVRTRYGPSRSVRDASIVTVVTPLAGRRSPVSAEPRTSVPVMSSGSTPTLVCVTVTGITTPSDRGRNRPSCTLVVASSVRDAR